MFLKNLGKNTDGVYVFEPENGRYAPLCVSCRINVTDKTKTVNSGRLGEKTYMGMSAYDWFGWLIIPPKDMLGLRRKIGAYLEKAPGGFTASLEKGLFVGIWDGLLNQPELEHDPIAGPGMVWSLELELEREIPSVWDQKWYEKMLADARPVCAEIGEILREGSSSWMDLGCRDISGKNYWQACLERDGPSLMAEMEARELEGEARETTGKGSRRI